MDNQAWDTEQKRVSYVTSQIAKRIEQLREEVGDVQTHMVDIRRNFWDEVTVNIDHEDDIAETMTSIRQQASVLSERERRHRQAVNELLQLERLQASPYFGRIDLIEEGTNEVMSIYIGTSSFLEDDEITFLVYDWRAPISSVYYDYAPGPIQYDTPGGTIKGEMTLKRQFIIQNGKIISLFDTGETIGDELLQHVLGQGADSQLKNIVATIQKEQNKVIRNDKSKLLVVQGAAGSGKTSAALQRVAYLLYKYRNSIRADQIILFSPNPLFNSYVSTVLPDLGEENMQQTTFMEYLEERVGTDLVVEDLYTQTEALLSETNEHTKETRKLNVSYKASTSFLEHIETYIRSLNESGVCFKNLSFQGEVRFTADEIAKYFYDLPATSSLRRRTDDVRDWLLKRVDELEKEEVKKDWVLEEVQLLSDEDYQKAYKMVQKEARKLTNNSYSEIDAETAILSTWVVQRKLKPLRRYIERNKFIDVPATYKRLFEAHRDDQKIQLPEYWERICQQTIERLNEGILPFEDAAPYVYLKEHLLGFKTYHAVRHVIVDEGQDYSPLQYEFLKRLFPQSRMTVLGDFNQAIHSYSDINILEWLTQLYGEDHTEQIHLTRSYRSTYEIVEFTKRIIHAGDRIEPFQRHGQKPTLFISADEQQHHRAIAQKIGQLVKDHATIAIICKTDQECEQAYTQLQHYPLPNKLERITSRSNRFTKGIVILPVYLAKGVEFDAVIIYDASANVYRLEQERKLLYTACTRAMHELHLFALGNISLLLNDVDPALWEQGSI